MTYLDYYATIMMTFLFLINKNKAPRDTRMIPASTTVSVFYVTFLMATAVHSAVIRDNQEATDVTMPSPQELPILDRVCS